MFAKGLEMLQIIDTQFWERFLFKIFSEYIVSVQTLLGTHAEFADII